MTQIKIIAVPPGQAPLEVRQQWVGITLPVAENLPSKTFEMGVFGGKPENSEGYLVETMLAFRELKKKSPEAADWWSSHLSPQLMPWLSFQRSVCEVVL
jgi:hypothetical protein